ncbi:MAG: ABC transporter substrate-binding protein [Chloroflexota bacterium]
MPKRQGKSGLSRRNFLRMAGAGLGVTIAGVAPSNLFSGLATQSALAQAARSGVLRVGWTPPVSLDPALYNDAPDISLGISVYDYLLNINQKSQIVPSLAKMPTVSDDGKVYTFALEPNVKFHDGSAFGAEDVKFTFERLMDEKTGSPARSLYGNIDKIEAVDAATVKFTLKAASAVFLTSLTDYHACILKKGTADPAKEFNGTGPFKTTKDKVDVTDRATLTANENYWKPGLPKLEGLELVFVKDIAALVTALKGGQLDWVPRIPVELFGDLEKDDTLSTVNIPTNSFPNIRIRADQKPGNDPDVVKAIRLSIDRDGLNKAVIQGLGAPGQDTPIGPLYKDFYSTATPLPKRDVAAAKALLEKAGYKDGLALDFYAPQGEFNADDLAQALQAQLKEAGITLTLKLVQPSVYYDKGPNTWLESTFGLTNWASRPDPQSYLDLIYKTGADYNEAHYSNPDLDKLIDAARVEVDVKKRATIMADIQKILIESGPSFIPYFYPLLAAQSKKVSGIEVAPDPGLTSFANAAIAK